MEELKRNKYPLSECLVLCEENRNSLAIAYVKGRLGFYDDSLAIYCGRMKKVLRALVKGQRMNHDRKRTKLFRILKSDFQCALNMCLEAENKEKVRIDMRYLLTRIVVTESAEIIDQHSSEIYISEGEKVFKQH